MSPQTRFGAQLWRGVALACVLGLVVAGALWWTLKDANTRRLTAYFPTAIGLYEGNSVRVRGVEMGTVERVQPMGDRVKVTVTYDRTVRLPADVQAVIVAPSLVSDRYIQFTPPYSGGPTLKNNAVIGQDRTAVPLEVDELYETLIEVSETLGPKGANKDGSLSRLLKTLAKNFKDNGKALNATIDKLGKASGTLDGSKDDLFATVTNLAKVTKTFANSDADVRKFERQLADVSSFLADERKNFSETVKVLGSTLAKVKKFIDDNKDRLRSNVDKLADVTKTLVEQRAALTEILDVAPVALSNVINAYNGNTGALDTRSDINELAQPPIVMICNILKQVPEAGEPLGQVCDKVAPLGDALPSVGSLINSLQNGKIPPPLRQLQAIQYGGGQ
ncbi:MCE family protein [Thermocrispum municipale]|uniref:MCE family protein n=1 Tax=Thermocrispum municipale TaxID=37926 RepID=UPI00048EFAD5|nr:MCE family protein [Thermocrispum municipale]